MPEKRPLGQPLSEASLPSALLVGMLSEESTRHVKVSEHSLRFCRRLLRLWVGVLTAVAWEAQSHNGAPHGRFVCFFWMTHFPPSSVSLCSQLPCRCLPAEGCLGLSVNLKDFLFSSQFGLADFCCEANSRAVNGPRPASPSFKSPVELGHQVVGEPLCGLCCAATFHVCCLRNTKLVSKLNSFQ